MCSHSYGTLFETDFFISRLKPVEGRETGRKAVYSMYFQQVVVVHGNNELPEIKIATATQDNKINLLFCFEIMPLYQKSHPKLLVAYRSFALMTNRPNLTLQKKSCSRTSGFIAEGEDIITSSEDHKKSRSNGIYVARELTRQLAKSTNSQGQVLIFTFIIRPW